MTEDITGAFSHTDLFTTGTIFDTGLVIDLDVIILIGNGIGGTCFDTHLTADAADLADRLDRLAQILSGTGNINTGPQGLQLDNILRTGFHADAAAYAFVRIDHGKILNHIYGIERAGLGTFTQTYAGVLTG